MGNRFITIDEAAKSLLDAWNKAVKESGATPEEQADAFNELAAWLGCFPPYESDLQRWLQARYQRLWGLGRG